MLAKRPRSDQDTRYLGFLTGGGGGIKETRDNF